uniref:Uncharacterized protein n=1 Tax=Arundo donax TaxID=35708 RepID=A0A0A8ZYH5_ARUDO
MHRLLLIFNIAFLNSLRSLANQF